MLLRYDPFEEMERQVDRMMRTTSAALPIDAYHREHEIVVEMDLPGVDPSTIDVTIERSALRVSAERQPRADDDSTPLITERRHGTFQRTLTLSQALDAEGTRAEYVDGVLRLKVPVADTARPRKVEVSTGDRTAIDVGERESSAA